MQTPITQAERDKIVALHAAGHTRNDIAKQTGRAAGSITKIVTDLGLSFDRSATKAATEAKVADGRARRAALMLDLLADAARLRAQLFAPCVVHAFGGKENTYAEHELNEPTFADKRNIVQAVSTAISTSLRLDQHDADSGADDAKSMLGALAEGLKAAYDELQQQGSPHGGD